MQPWLQMNTLRKTYLFRKNSTTGVDKMSKREKPKRVKFIHHWPKEYRIYPANGAWGGVTGRGDFVFHFFVERHDIPEEDIQNVQEDGSLTPLEKEIPEELPIARDMQVGILMNREQSVSLANWILEQVKMHEERKR